jgi:hypothetical protein
MRLGQILEARHMQLESGIVHKDVVVKKKTGAAFFAFFMPLMEPGVTFRLVFKWSTITRSFGPLDSL